MKSAAYLIVGGLAYLVALHKAVALRRTRGDYALWALLIAAFVGASAFVFASAPVYTAIDRWIGVPNAATLIVYACGTVFWPVFLSVLWLWQYPPVQAWRRIRLVLLAGAAVLLTQVILFQFADVPDEHVWDFDLTYGPDPLVGAYLLVFYPPLAVGLAIASRLTWRYSQVGGSPWRRRGLRAASIGCLIEVGFPGCKSAYVLFAWAGHRHVWLHDLAVGCALVGSFFITNLSQAAWGPRVSEFVAWWRRWRAYHELHPLWSAITNRFPYLVLEDRPRGRLADLMTLRHLKFRLFRRYVEIRDGIRALRPYEAPGDLAHAEDAGNARGLTGESLAAFIEATRIKAALNRPTPSTSAHESPQELPGGDDLHSDVGWLVRVARALPHAPLPPLRVGAVVSDASPRG